MRNQKQLVYICTVVANVTLPFLLPFIQFARLENVHKTVPEPVPFSSFPVLYCNAANAVASL